MSLELAVRQIGFTAALPELRYMPSGDAVTTIRVGTTDRWKDKDGEIQERTTWLRWSCFGKSAENLAKMVGKGAYVALEGTIRNQKWDDKDGNTQYRDSYVVDEWRLLDRKPKDVGADGAADEATGAGVPPQSGWGGDDDVPF
ncbi:MAG: single-stranded DNA-binding protein [Gallionellaceae bacterium]|nr:single-stranded DNA-binding protein [Gallionellaceae bacterium]